MSIDQAVVETLKVVPVVGVLFWVLKVGLELLREDIVERRKITDDFLTAIRTVAETATAAVTSSNEQTQALTQAVSGLKATHTLEHQEIVLELRALTGHISKLSFPKPGIITDLTQPSAVSTTH